MNTTDNNKIIANFMGLKPKCERDGVYSFSDLPFFSIRENDIDKVVEGIAKYSKYHSSWSWLMEVIEKIETLGYWVEFRTQNKGFRVAIGDYNFDTKPISNIFKVNKIDACYDAAIYFIKCYNKQNKTNE